MFSPADRQRAFDEVCRTRCTRKVALAAWCAAVESGNQAAIVSSYQELKQARMDDAAAIEAYRRITAVPHAP